MNNTEQFYKYGHRGAGLYQMADDIRFGGGDVNRDSQGRILCSCGAAMGTDRAATICPKAQVIGIDVHREEVNTLVSNFGNVKSGAKIRKKVNQIYGRQLEDIQRQAKRELDQEVARRLAHFNENLVRKKPRLVPSFIWRILQDIVLKRGTIV